MITTLFYPLSRLVRTFLFIAVAQLLFCGSLVSAPLEITVGDTKERPLQHAAERIHISQSGIVDLFMPEKKKLSIHGINAGITTVTIEYANDKVEEMAVMVLSKKGASAEVIRDYVQKNLGGIDSLSFEIIPASSKTAQDKVAIAGAADMRYRPLVHSVSSLFPERIENKVQYKDSTVEETATFLKRALQSEKNVQISMTDDDKIQLQGKVDAERYPAYKQLVNSFSNVVKDSVKEVETAGEKQKKKEDRWENMMIQVDVEVVEVNLNEMRAVGVEWLDDSNTLAISADASGSGDPFEFGSFSYSSSLNAENLKVTLQALANEGYGTILANPRLKVRNGEQASFVVGGGSAHCVHDVRHLIGGIQEFWHPVKNDSAHIGQESHHARPKCDRKHPEFFQCRERQSRYRQERRPYQSDDPGRRILCPCRSNRAYGRRKRDKSAFAWRSAIGGCSFHQHEP